MILHPHEEEGSGPPKKESALIQVQFFQGIECRRNVMRIAVVLF